MRGGPGRAAGTPTCPRTPPAQAEWGRAASASSSVRTGAVRAQVVLLGSRTHSSWQPAVLPSGPEKAERECAIRPLTTPKREAYRCSKRGLGQTWGASGRLREAAHCNPGISREQRPAGLGREAGGGGVPAQCRTPCLSHGPAALLGFTGTPATVRTARDMEPAPHTHEHTARRPRPGSHTEPAGQLPASAYGSHLTPRERLTLIGGRKTLVFHAYLETSERTRRTPFHLPSHTSGV